MSNDIKTLADAQPGGRVRLGDQAERARFEAWAEGAGYALTREDGRYEFAATRCAWTAWRAAAESRQIGAHEPAAWVPPNFFNKGVVAATARRNPPSETAVELRGEYVPLYLSAQPSPGGQGDALAMIQRYDDACIAFTLSVTDERCDDTKRRELRRAVTAARNEVVFALAARQPVGEDWQRIANEWADATANGVQWLRNIRDGASTVADALACMESNVERIQQIKPQPVGVPTAWMHTHKATGRVEFGLSPMYDCDSNAEKWDSVALYTAPPAQAVDLGAVRYALDAAEGLAVACASVDGFSREEIASAGREMRKQFADARALIDGKAVGK